jgi:hypothetical protein
MGEIGRLREIIHEKTAEVEDLRNCLDCEKHNKIQIEAALRTKIESLMT